MNRHALFSSRTGIILCCLIAGFGADAGQWPEFRGTGGVGQVAGAPEFPLIWSETNNVAWKTKVIRAGKTYELLAENQLDAGFMASPAVLDDALILRTKTHLYRISQP